MGDAPNQTPKAVDAASNTIVLAFDLLDDQITRLPGELAKSLQSPAVQAAIKSVLMKFALAKQTTPATTISDKEATAFANALLKGTRAAVQKDVLDQVKRTPSYKALEAGWKVFGETLKSAPIGVWVDRHAGVLYVVGAGLALGGAAALYVTKTGGPIVKLPISQLTGKSVQMFKVGRFSLKGTLLAFQPETRTVGVSLTGSEKLDRVDISVQLGVVASGADVKQVNGQVVFKTPDIKLAITGSDKPAEKTVNLGLSLAVRNSGLPGPLSVGLGIGLKDGKPTQGSVNIGLKTDYGTVGALGGTGKNDLTGEAEAKGLLTWELSL